MALAFRSTIELVGPRREFNPILAAIAELHAIIQAIEYERVKDIRMAK
jgi:hypothetical protein